MNSAVFLDRDGVIIQNRAAYVRCWEDVEFLPSSLHALQLLADSRHKIVIVTNQSVIGRGIITLEQANKINQKIVQTINDAGGRVDGLFVCPHSPQDGCLCRKPLPGLILQAADALSIDLRSSFMIGDALSDIQSGQAAGIQTNILVKTGRGFEQLRSASDKRIPRFIVVDQLVEAVELILSNRLPSGDLF